MRPPTWLIVVFVGAFIGVVFAGLSTYDFVQHLDRQVHSLHCSFIPGMGAGGGDSGCQVAMMSPYSSVFRARVWGGIPIALPAMAVFAFIAFYGLHLLLTRRTQDRRATMFLAAACALPALASVVMLTISLTKLGALCKLCIAIYIASAACLTGGVMLWRKAVKAPIAEEPVGNKLLGIMFGVGVAFVVVPLVIYMALAPDHSKFLGTCENLTKTDDPYGVMVRLDRNASAKAAPAIEILDPLCPACKAFEERLESSGLVDRLDRRVILFPLDTECNWMISETTHPGACTVSEAVLCAGDKAPEVIQWAFEVQADIRDQAKTDKTAAARIVKQRFPELASCVGSAEARAKVNKSMRWAVSHNIRVLTPQLFVGGTKLCDEDVDIGLDYALTRLLDAYDRGATFARPPAEAPLETGTGDMGGHGSGHPMTKPAEPKKEPKPAAPPSGDQPAAGSGEKPITSPSETPKEEPAKEEPAKEEPAKEEAPKPAPKDPMPTEESAGSGGAP
ncbi:MAG: thioredoxin domain-containing protein [Myxococcales bacterium]|nr:thioredoxin domain-containing protein [Myxococcales bacterium]